MIGVAIAIVAAIALTALQVGVVPALPAPYALLHLPLIAVVRELSVFRFKNAFAIAITTGLIIDLLTATAFGAETGILLLLTFVLMTLFTRVFTNSSLPALLALNTAGWLAMHAVFFLRSVITATFAGGDVGMLVGWDRVVPLIGGLGIQLLAVIAVAMLVAGIRHIVGSVIILR